MRATVGQELARTLDALAASDARARLAARLPGGEAAAAALVPAQPGEGEAAARGRMLLSALGGRLRGGLLAGGGGSGSSSGGSISSGAGLGGLLPSPGDAAAAAAALQDAAARTWPQLRDALRSPAAQELAREVAGALSARFLARCVKFGFGAGDLLARRAADGAKADPRFI